MSSQAEEPPPGEGITCPGCAAPNLPNEDFCSACGRPLSATSTLDPLKSIRAEGYVFRQAATGRPSRLILAGIWLVVLAGVVGTALLWWQEADMPGAVCFTLTVVLGGLLLYRSTRNHLRPR